MSEYVVIYEQADDGGLGCLPTRPHRVVAIESRHVVEERIQEALTAYVEDLRERGGTPPLPHHDTGVVAA